MVNAELGRQNRERLSLLEEVEMERATHTSAAGQVEALNVLRSRLLSQIRECHRESERQDFSSNERRLRIAAWNMEIYLDTTEPETTRKLAASFIKEVLVRSGSATVRYTVPMPPLSPAGNTTYEEINL